MVTEARSAVMGAKTVKQAAEAEKEMQGALGKIFAIAEAYPELKANTNFVKLQEQLQDVEDKIQAARRFYNAGAKELNTKVLYDDYYVSLIWHVAYCLSVAASESSCDRKYGNYLTAGDRIEQIARVRELITEIEGLKGRKVVRNPKLRDLNMGDFNKDIAHIQKLIKEIKHYGCPDYMKTYFKQFAELYKGIEKPVILSN